MISYRPNVALILRRADGAVLIGERIDVPGSWQFPQGGVQAGETLEEALTREVMEELSLSGECYSVVEIRGPYRYAFPPGRTKEGFGGQEQTYFLAEFLGREEGILDAPETEEFRAVRWIQPSDFPFASLPPMKQSVYRKVLSDFFGVSFPSLPETGDHAKKMKLD